ncbi:MAG TPA: oxidoreductase [Planctomycetaceae bacterium]|mgnify:CR=1 FL=1|nr:oxidoreductase [Planctomycetaceae bacterium]
MPLTPIRIAMHGVTGRMGTNQHLIRSILPIIKQGGVKLSTGQWQQIEPILVGRDAAKLKHLAETVSMQEIGRAIEFTTNLESILLDESVEIVFDAASTNLRPEILRAAMERGKAVYCEKPIAINANEASELVALAEKTGVKNGVVQDKLWLPGIRKLRMLRDQGFFGKILGVRAEFGYWVFSGHDQDQPPQRPSWNYRSEDGGGMMIDMFCHWEYLINDLFGPIERVLAHKTTDIAERIDESGEPYQCTADDSASALFVLKNGLTCQFNSSWTTRVRRDDLLNIQVDGTEGSAVAGLRDCWIQSLSATPRPTWNPDVPQPIHFYDNWQILPNSTEYDNAFKIQWEQFIRHCVDDADFPWTLSSAAAGVRLAEAGAISANEQIWVTL